MKLHCICAMVLKALLNVIFFLSLLSLLYSNPTFAIPPINPRGHLKFPRLPSFDLPFHHPTHSHQSPSYAPRNVPCPPSNTTYIRPGTLGLNPSEANYIHTLRSPSTTAHLHPFALAANLTPAQADQILRNETLRPISAIAFSGGGYRAMLNGAGVFRALDNRTSSVPAFAGLLQGMDYMAGLSGGNWLVGASALAGFADMDELRLRHWELEKGLVTGVKGDPKRHVEGVVGYLLGIRDQVLKKAKGGFVVTLTDYWALALGRRLLRGEGGSNVTWSGIRDTGAFKRGEMPFPISISDGRRPGERIVEVNSTVYEATPYAFGSWDREVDYFFPMEYLGTRMRGGSPEDGEKCVKGFDRGEFIMGTSSSLFSGVLARVGRQNAGNGTDVGGKLFTYLKGRVEGILANVLAKAQGGNEDIADYPNPFHGYPPSSSPPNLVQNQTSLSLADGGLDNQNIPLWPLLQPARKVDFILAVDSSADTPQHWPNGSSLVATQRRTQNLLRQFKPGDVGVVPFPYVPGDFRAWVDQGLNNNPVFFGCSSGNYSAVHPPGGTSSSNSSHLSAYAGPLILYLPNAPWTYYTNTSTFQLDYIQAELSGFFSNGAGQIAQSAFSNNSTNTTFPATTAWKTCAACAIMQRSKERAGIPLGPACKACFDRYCWGGGYPEARGNVTSHVRNGVYDPVRKDGSEGSFASQHVTIEEERRREGVGK